MGQGLAELFGNHAEREGELALISALEEKTRSGKLIWTVGDKSVSASVGGMRFQFVVAPSWLPPFRRDWGLFSVYKGEKEILQVKPEPPNLAGMLAALTPGGPPVPAIPMPTPERAADSLYRAIAGASNSEIEDAIAIINKI